MNLKNFEQNFLHKKVKKINTLKTEIPNIPELICPSLIQIHTKNYNFIYQTIEKELENNYCLWIDTDHCTDFARFNPKNLLISQPNSPEEALNILSEPLLKCLKIVVIDSVLNLLPLNRDYVWLEKKMGEIRQIMRNTDCIIFFINPYIQNKYDIFEKYMDYIIKIDKNTGKVVKNIKNLKINHNQ